MRRIKIRDVDGRRVEKDINEILHEFINRDKCRCDELGAIPA